MTLSDFISAYSGKPVDFDGIYPNQCMDLAHWYIYSVLNITDKTVCAAPSAYQVFTNFDNSSAKVYFEKIVNTPDNVPLAGDIIVWGQEVSPYGHIAVFVDGDVNTFHSFDANWPLSALPHLQEHNYSGVLGWLRYNKQIDTSKSNEQVQGELRSQIEAVQMCQISLKSATDQLNIALADNGDLLQLNKELKSKHEEDQRTIIALKSELETVHKEDKDYAVESYEAQQAKKESDNILIKAADELGVKYNPSDKEGNQLILKAIQEVVEYAKKLEHAFTSQPITQDPRTVTPSPLVSVQRSNVFTSIGDVLFGWMFVK